MTWTSSNRAQRLPADWKQRRAKVKARAHNKCQATHHHPQCDGKATDIDHINAGDNHELANLQALSTACHKAKTNAENKARRQLNARQRRRATEPHPGRIRRSA